MKIALLSPLILPVPPIKYGGTERIVHSLSIELTKMGHEVRVYALEGSANPFTVPFPQGAYQLQRRKAIDWEPDIFHYHYAPPYTHRDHIITYHWIGDTYSPEGIYPNSYLTGLSHDQVKGFREAGIDMTRYVGLAHNGIDLNQCPFVGGKKEYLAFCARIHPHKGITDAVKVAESVKIPLLYAGNIQDRELFQSIQYSKYSRWIGEVDDLGRALLLRDAYAYLFPLNYRETCCLSAMEAMGCGVPVLTYDKGCMSELVKDGVTGFICDNVDDMIQKVKQVDSLSRKDCRDWVQDNFSAPVMASKYQKIYEKVEDFKCR